MGAKLVKNAKIGVSSCKNYTPSLTLKQFVDAYSIQLFLILIIFLYTPKLLKLVMIIASQL